MCILLRKSWKKGGNYVRLEIHIQEPFRILQKCWLLFLSTSWLRSDLSRKKNWETGISFRRLSSGVLSPTDSWSKWDVTWKLPLCFSVSFIPTNVLSQGAVGVEITIRVKMATWSCISCWWISEGKGGRLPQAPDPYRRPCQFLLFLAAIAGTHLGLLVSLGHFSSAMESGP